jgi:DNA modification methylase
LRPIIACASNPGDLVIDPFCGSATTGRICIEYGRRFVGIEKGEEFARLAKQRLTQVTPPLCFG